MTDRALLDHISRLPHARANFKQLVRELGAKGSERTELETRSRAWSPRGDLIELRSGQYAVTARSREFAVGRLQHASRRLRLPDSRPPHRRRRRRHLHSARLRRNAPCTATASWCASPASRPTAAPTARSSRFCKRAHPTVVGEFHIGRARQLRRPARRPHPASGSRFPKAWRSRPPAPSSATASASRRRRSPSVGGPGRHDRQRRAARVSREGRGAGRPRDRDPGPSRTISASTSRSSSASTTCRTSFRPKCWSRREAIPNIITPRELEGRRDFREHGRSSPSTARPRAISTTPSGWTGCPTATTRCTSTSPTSATTCARARPSTPRRGCAAPASTFPTAPCPCCRSSSPPTSARSSRRWTGWCSRRCSRSIIRATSWRRSSRRGVIRSVERMTYTNVHLLLEGDAGLRERYARWSRASS